MYVETEINKQNERMKNDGWIHLLPVFGCMHGGLYMLGIGSDRMEDHELRWVSNSAAVAKAPPVMAFSTTLSRWWLFTAETKAPVTAPPSIAFFCMHATLHIYHPSQINITQLMHLHLYIQPQINIPSALNY